MQGTFTTTPNHKSLCFKRTRLGVSLAESGTHSSCVCPYSHQAQFLTDIFLNIFFLILQVFFSFHFPLSAVRSTLPSPGHDHTRRMEHGEFLEPAEALDFPGNPFALSGCTSAAPWECISAPSCSQVQPTDNKSRIPFSLQAACPGF